jgi:hypothetical protein
MLLSRMAGEPAPPELAALAQALADAEPTIRTTLALGAATRLQKVLDAPRDQIRADFFVDRFLGLGMVPREAVDRELAVVRAKPGKHGPSFDARKPIVRVDALLWIAALSSPADRGEIAAWPMKFYADTLVRVPAADQYGIDTGRPVGTQARPVMGAVFAPLLAGSSVK